ncbi:hypothetical protein DLM78_21340 [Leptospira stimsonii]|uniref:Uncharacterized protein n=1 Tax=Leptospira stimsonii TaxID=2202203 RepID=A0A8B3CJQ5_9LEPT|nr:hypothetical protein DLM78_21340 [Leptospira stimsonii]
MENIKSEFLMSLGRFVVTFSKIQSILQEGIYVLLAKIHSIEDNMVRTFMHRMLISQLQEVFLTLATEHKSKLEHMNEKLFVGIRSIISSKLDDIKN